MQNRPFVYYSLLPGFCLLLHYCVDFLRVVKIKTRGHITYLRGAVGLALVSLSGTR